MLSFSLTGSIRCFLATGDELSLAVSSVISREGASPRVAWVVCVARDDDLRAEILGRFLEGDLVQIEGDIEQSRRQVGALAFHSVAFVIHEVRRQDRVGMASMDEAELEELLAVRPSPHERADLSPEEMLIAGERFAHMTALVLALPEKERLALVLFKLKGLSHKEIAERLGVSQHTVPYYLSRALAKCATGLAAFDRALPDGAKRS